ncbi:C4-dicarboxylate transporter/malic acid transport protein [Atractiella rhizophila]|nr:C4-dicarboxylate transporter/malic acid transport protein [Atractiella rhizophila]
MDSSNPYYISQPAWGIRNRILRFTPGWWSVIMGTGILSNLIFDIPYDTHGVLRIISTVIFVINLAFAALFTFFTIARYIMFPKLLPALVSNEVHSMFLGTIPMGLVTIVTGIHQLGHSYSLPHVTIVTSTLWWIAGTLAVLTVVGVPFFMSTRQSHKPEGMTALWLLPIVPPITIAASGSGIIPALHAEGHATYALVILLASYAVLGIGLLLAYSILTLYFQRLAHHHLPAPSLLLTVFLPLGPCGQGGFSLLRLGKDAASLFAENSDEGLRELGKAMYGAGAVLSLLFWGLGMWWFALAAATLLPRFLWGAEGEGRECVGGAEGKGGRSGIEFSIGWWSFTFPIGSMTLLTFGLGDTFKSPFFNALGTIMTATVGFFFVVVIGPTVVGFVKGSLFQAPCLAKLERGYGLTEGEKERVFGTTKGEAEERRVDRDL